MPVAAPSPLPQLSRDDIDDLIYDARTADLAALNTTLSNLSTAHATSQARIIQAAIDDDEDLEQKSGGGGSGSSSGGSSGCSLLHWPAANGREDILTHLLSVVRGDGDKAIRSDDKKSEGGATSSSSALTALLDHRNRSGNTALHWAALNAHLACVKALVAEGADVHIKNEAGRDIRQEAELSGKEGAAEVAEWIFVNCGGLEAQAEAEEVGGEVAVGPPGNKGEGGAATEGVAVREDIVDERQ